MFDNLKNEPEDLFAETDASAPQIPSPTSTPLAATPAMNSNSSPAPAPVPVPAPVPAPLPSVEAPSASRSIPWKMIILFVAIVAVIILAFFLSMRILKSRTPVTPSAPTEIKKESVEETPAAQEEEAVVQEQPAEVPLEIDTDKDGLTDSQEAGLGTNPNSTDTDADGLFDREEVEVYKINPLNPDTDGDTFLDGAEVKAGYNPNGPGKLLEIPKK